MRRDTGIPRYSQYLAPLGAAARPHSALIPLRCGKSLAGRTRHERVLLVQAGDVVSVPPGELLRRPTILDARTRSVHRIRFPPKCNTLRHAAHLTVRSKLRYGRNLRGCEGARETGGRAVDSGLSLTITKTKLCLRHELPAQAHPQGPSCCDEFDGCCRIAERHNPEIATIDVHMRNGLHTTGPSRPIR